MTRYEPPFINYEGQFSGGDHRLIHVEKISRRGGKYNWELSPHRHRDLFQLTVVQHGKGHVNIDLVEQPFLSPAIILIPPLVVHNFAYDSKASGTILTISDEYIRTLARLAEEPTLLESLSFPFALCLEEDVAALNNIASMLDIISDSLLSSRRGKSAVISAGVLTIFGHLVPYAEKMRANARAHSRQYELYARFRTLLGEHYRKQLPMEDYAGMLAVTERTLQRACAIVAGESPLKIAHRLTTLEAQRMLQYSSLTVSEIGYYLGFKDPSNFSRFFAENVGESPLAFRRTRLGIM